MVAGCEAGGRVNCGGRGAGRGCRDLGSSAQPGSTTSPAGLAHANKYRLGPQPTRATRRTAKIHFNKHPATISACRAPLHDTRASACPRTSPVLCAPGPCPGGHPRSVVLSPHVRCQGCATSRRDQKAEGPTPKYDDAGAGPGSVSPPGRAGRADQALGCPGGGSREQRGGTPGRGSLQRLSAIRAHKRLWRSRRL